LSEAHPTISSSHWISIFSTFIQALCSLTRFKEYGMSEIYFEQQLAAVTLILIRREKNTAE
jgi:hypothetical protein